MLLAVLVGGGYAVLQFRARRSAASALNLETEPARRGSLTATVGATGTVRSNQSAVLSWQTSGRVGAVNVAPGASVTPGQELARLEQTSLPQSVILAQAELYSAQRALNDLLESSLARAQALKALDEAERALAELRDNFPLEQAQARLALLQAQDALEEAERKRNNLNYPRASQSVINAAEAEYILAQNEVDRLRTEFNMVSGRPADDPVRALALTRLSAAEQNRDALLRRLNWYRGTPSEAEIAEAEANLALARARLAEAEADWERIQDGPNPADVALLEAQLAEAQRQWSRVKDGPDPDEVAAARARVAAAQAILEAAALKAPFAGVVTAVEILPGDQVAPGAVAFRIDDLSRLLVDVAVSEVDINRIRIGQPVILTFDAVLGKEYHGEVRQVATVGDVIQGAVSFQVRVELLDPDADVKPGMTAAVNIVVSELDDVLLVPNRAVRVRDGSRVVFVLRNGALEPVEITLGASSEAESEVLAGEIRPGDLIVLNPPPEPILFGPGGGGP